MSGMQELGDAIERRDRLIADLREQLAAAERDGERYRTLRGLAVKHEQVRICWMDFADPGEPADLQWSVEVGQYEREDYLAPEKTLDAVLDNAARAQAPGGEPRCVYCQKPATCIGRYEDHQTDTFCCDDCCGHGNEDGRCRPVEPAPGKAGAE